MQVQQAADPSRLENFLVQVPNRPLSKPERAVYRKLCYNFARLDAITQTAVYAAALQAHRSREMAQRFAETIQFVYALQEQFTDPEQYAVMNTFNRALLQQDGETLLGIHRSAGLYAERIVNEPYPEPRPRFGRRSAF